MIRVTPSEPFSEDPDAVWLREASRPGPIDEPRRLAGLWLAALVLAVAVISGCSQAGAAQEPSASPADLKRAAMSAWACPGMHAEWSGEVVSCLRERP